MCMSKFRSGTTLLLLTFFITFSLAVAGASATGTVAGKVVDPLGAVVPKADVTLLQNGKVVGVTEDGPGRKICLSRRLTLANTSSESKHPDSHSRKASPCILRQPERSASK